jgi:hypothetical protein
LSNKISWVIIRCPYFLLRRVSTLLKGYIPLKNAIRESPGFINSIDLPQIINVKNWL